MHFLKRNRARNFVDQSVKAWHKHPEAQQQANITIDDAQAAQDVLNLIDELNGCTYMMQTLKNRIQYIDDNIEDQKDPAIKESMYHEKLVLEKRVISLS